MKLLHGGHGQPRQGAFLSIQDDHMTACDSAQWMNLSSYLKTVAW